MTDEERKREAFENAKEIQNMDPTQFRKDRHGLPMDIYQYEISGLGGWEAVCIGDGKIEALAYRFGGLPVMGDKPLHPTGEAAGEANSKWHLPSLKSED